MPLQEDYRVSLDAFQGPLDLLLFLIRRAEVDVSDIPVAAITDQYLAFLRQIDDVDVELAGEFLVMAATLIEIKSRTLVPPEQHGEDGQSTTDTPDETSGGGGGGDPRYELVQQLLAYQRYRIASEALDARRIEFEQRFPRRPGRAQHAESADESAELIELELDDVHVMDLADTYEHIMASIDFTRLGDHVVEMDETPIELHEEDLLDRLERAPGNRLTLQSTFEGQSRVQRIGMFLATLELVRLHRVTVIQNDIDAEIELVLLSDDPDLLVIETDEISHWHGKGD